MDTMLIKQLKFSNPWWAYKDAINSDSLVIDFKKQKYQYYHSLYGSFPENKECVLTLRGPRRVGKSTLVKLIIKKLLDKQVRKENIFFATCDRMENFNELHSLIKTYLDFARPRTKEHLYIFLDEVSFVKDWQRAVKELVDSGLLKGVTCLFTGSNILDIKFSGELLAGRRGKISPADIEFRGLTFGEFIKLTRPNLYARDLFKASYKLPHYKKIFEDYLLTGGFLMNINEYYRNGYLANSAYETLIAWLEGDLHKTGKSEATAYNIFSVLLKSLTTPLSFVGIARDIGITSHLAVQEYLEIFEKMFFISRVDYFSLGQRKTEIRKNKKFYFTDPFIMASVKAKVDAALGNPFAYSKQIIEDQKDKLAENAVAYHLKRKFPQLYFGRSKKDQEIDFVGKLDGKYAFFEVKYQNRVSSSEFAFFKDKFKKEKLTVLTKDNLEKDGNIELAPLELYLSAI